MFKPRTLLHNGSINEFHHWQKHFGANFQQNNIAKNNFPMQRSFLITCLDDKLAAVLHSTNTTAITNQLKTWFDLPVLGWPQTIRSDGGPQYRTEFAQFCTKHDIKHKLTSPHNPQANGLAESAVKNAKHLLIKCKQNNLNFQTALACFRNTPRADGYSPAQLFMGRRQQTSMPLNQEEIRQAVQRRDEEIPKTEEYKK